MSSPGRKPKHDHDRTSFGHPHRGRPSAGFADHLLAVRERQRPEDLAGVSLELSAAGTLVLVEHTRKGASLRNHVRKFPLELSMLLPDGTVVWVEVSAIEPAVKPTAEQIAEMLALVVPCSLWEFGSGE